VSTSPTLASQYDQSEPVHTISFVIVTWNACATIARCLDSVAAEVPNAEVILVDNNSSDETADLVAACYPHVHLIRNHRNEGFGYACNAGAARARGEYLFFLNPDARLEPNSIQRMLGVLRESPQTAIAGPALQGSRGAAVSGGQRFLTLRTFCLYRVFGWNKVQVPAEVSNVDWVSGAALLIRRPAFKELGGFDRRFWMYVEDMHLCWKARARGWKVSIIPTATVTHDHSTSARNNVEQTLRSNAANTLLWFEETGSRRRALVARPLLFASLMAVGTKHCLIARSVRTLPIYIRIGWLVLSAPARLTSWPDMPESRETHLS
jgi:N-acetylglucosaminyl-diphospho-decaprenol L-rhamnosyltransferase